MPCGQFLDLYWTEGKQNIGLKKGVLEIYLNLDLKHSPSETSFFVERPQNSPWATSQD